MELSTLTIASVQRGLEQKDFSAVELVHEYLQHAEKTDQHYGAWLRTRREVVAEAKLVDQRLSAGTALRPLEGVPMAVKDNLLLEGEIATAGSKILADYRAVYTATAVERLQAQGALVIGKTNL